MFNRQVGCIGCDAQMAIAPAGASALWARAVPLMAALAASSFLWMCVLDRHSGDRQAGHVRGCRELTRRPAGLDPGP
jgi:hypothetical protein